MKRTIKILVLVVLAAVAVSVGVHVYYLSLPRVSLLVYRDSKVTGCKERLNETVILHVKNDGTVDLYLNACRIGQTVLTYGLSVSYIFQSDIEIPVGVEAVITFPAAGGEVVVETVSGPPGAVASGGVYAISDNPDSNPLGTGGRISLLIYTRLGKIGGGEETSIALEE